MAFNQVGFVHGFKVSVLDNEPASHHCVVSFYRLASEAIKKGGTLVGLKKLKVMRDIMQMKYEYPNDQAEKLDELHKKLEESIHEFGSIFE